MITTKELKSPTRKIHRKHLKFVVFIDGFLREIKFVGKLIVCKFIDGFFLSLSIINGFIRR